MYRLIVLATSLLIAPSAFAGQPGSDVQTVASVPAAADKVYPPLPTLTMLPPAADDDEDAPPRPTAHKKKSRVPERKSVGLTPRLVVSDASHAYLGNVERQLDLALLK
jgi:hypothetical protein